MLMVFIAALAVGILAAIIAYFIHRLTGAATRWLIPVSAGAGMLGFTIWNDYSWFDRQRAGLPDGVQVAAIYRHKSPIQPWTLIAPVINRYTAIDMRAAERHPDHPEIVRAPMYFAQRYQPTAVSPQVVDCARRRRADAADAGEDGLPPEDAWFTLVPDHPLLRIMCAGETG